MKLADILTVDAVSDARFATLELAGISTDSRTVKPGDLFVAVAGAKDDGLRFVGDALASGAAAIMAERIPPMPLPDGVAFIRVDDARRALALACGQILFAPAGSDRRDHRHQRKDVGRRLHASDLDGARPAGGEHRDRRAGIPDARGLRLAHHPRPGGAAPLARRACRRRRDAPCDGSVIARPRSAPARRRSGGGRRLHQSQPRPPRLSSDAGRLSRRQAQAVHRSDRSRRCRRGRRRPRAGRRGGRGGAPARGCGSLRSAGAATASASSRPRPKASHRCSSSRMPAATTRCACRCPAPSRSRMRWWRRASFWRPAANPAATFAALAQLKGAKGRLELVGENNGAPIFVDYAHKPDALAKALEALRPYVTRRLVVVFGCGGDRDAGKRPMMGAIAARAGRPGRRHRRQPAQRRPGGDPRRDPAGVARRARDRRPARGDPGARSQTCAAATCC